MKPGYDIPETFEKKKMCKHSFFVFFLSSYGSFVKMGPFPNFLSRWDFSVTGGIMAFQTHETKNKHHHLELPPTQ